MTASKNDNATGKGGEVGISENSRDKFNARSTATKAQMDRLVELLRVRQRHTHELRMSGISHPAGRIQDLEALGFVIASDRTTTVDGDGFIHSRVAIYTIVSEPEIV